MVDFRTFLQSALVLLLWPFLQIVSVFRLKRPLTGVAAWYGVTLGGLVALPLVYAMPWILQHIPGCSMVDGDWLWVRVAAAIGAMVAGAATATFSFPGDDLGGGAHMSSVAIMAGAAAASLSGFVAAPLTECWWLSLLVGAVSAVFVGGMWGALVGEPLGLFLRSLAGLARSEFVGIPALDRVPEAAPEELVQKHTYHPDLSKLLTLTTPAWLLVAAIGRNEWSLSVVAGACFIWVVARRLVTPPLTLSPQGVRVGSGPILHWQDVRCAAIEAERYRLHLLPRTTASSASSELTWPWFYASLHQQVSLASLLRAQLGDQRLRLVPAPIATRARVARDLATAKKRLAQGQARYVIANANAAIAGAEECGAHDLAVEARILNSQALLSHGAVAAACDLATTAVEQAERLAIRELLAKALVNEARLLAVLAPMLRRLDTLVERASCAGAAESAATADDFAVLRTLRLLRREPRQNLLTQVDPSADPAPAPVEQVVLRRIRAELLVRQADDQATALDARELYRRAVHDYDWLMTRAPRHFGHVERASRAWCLHRLGETAQSRTELDAALRAARADEDLFGEAACLWRRALRAADRREWEDAYYELRIACDRVESLRWGSQVDWQKMAVSGGQRQQIYEAMVDLCLRLPAAVLEALQVAAPVRAWEYAERSKSRALLDLLGAERLRDGPTPASQETPVLRTASVPVRGQLRSQRNVVPTATEAGCRGISESPFRSLQVLSAVELQTLQAGLGPDAALLEYYRVARRWLAFVITKDHCQAQWLATDGVDLDCTVPEFHRALSEKRPLREILPLAQRLYGVLWRPLADRLARRIVYVVPHGVLHALPFSALQDGQRWLLETGVAPVYGLSASTLVRAWGGVLPADPTFCGFANPYGDTYLSAVADEVHESAATYKTRRVLPDRTATNYPSPDDFFRFAPDADVVHLACHGLRDDDPLESGFLLHKANGQTQRVSTREIIGMRMKARLLVASLCHGGSGHLEAGDEWLGLLRAFIAAGVHAVVAPRWEIEDEIARSAMTGLHRRLRTDTLAEAVRATALELLRQPCSAHPYFWGGLGVWGDAGPIRSPVA